ncbi:cell division/cell wall cluster transcriptional repressor MraZ [Candidatus Uhrbacteria bacterium RIFCSPLOWO2_12_FULL_46_10]|uniref:Transcriptional regulator MraZ n=1 Tax=Candidatus Uhrbacteria bacterium RIFCSPLOWO2_01_FULL_47_25 TaxID=1802402 RepID=A0A1F7UUX2_9BACT|nr:MAG: Protein MraZ [Parcubacteria group bacterium GW2011_GWA2_46_9]OGL68316.1 MAG: cell division/cell wall cluster transcriptional repressor MraZ [Candidatus Uhrbacteria bacterium RIFCSPHIGHO2_02_FULL_47_29]OGL75224.1 MAG: cell division/cell wall cluster transcriptional repressor MraZ [Candidatus Uhrbacteria bacterium RIFCSPHIGHO2_12_FULL_46_13]OGL81477.1 MAG: cell division/cell wall cluster transcriptional repressor MraZ [Candidatus Uhrbacteria bacterium RIFCSPLOWO2_01_FULL_47_25]OGL85137.1 
MFIGEYSHTVDAKGRIALPTKFRHLFADGAVVTRGLDSCLFLYPLKEWQSLATKLAALPLSQANTRAFARLMLAGAMEVFLDKQGRLMIPEYLRSYAYLKKRVVVTGLFNRLELWDSDHWESYRQGTEQNSGAIAEALNNLGV